MLVVFTFECVGEKRRECLLQFVVLVTVFHALRSKILGFSNEECLPFAKSTQLQVVSFRRNTEIFVPELLTLECWLPLWPFWTGEALPTAYTLCQLWGTFKKVPNNREIATNNVPLNSMGIYIYIFSPPWACFCHKQLKEEEGLWKLPSSFLVADMALVCPLSPVEQSVKAGQCLSLPGHFPM